MNIRRYQGWALMVGLPIALLSFVVGDAPWFGIISVIGTILFIVGAPAIQSVQPMGTAGLIGIILIELAAIIALGINLFGGPEVSEALIFTSVLAGALGRIIIGWLTTKANVFPAWVGWTFLLHGILNLAGYLFLYDLGTFGSVLGMVAYLLDEAAAFGFGLGIVQRQS
jgi:hypothetical protein